MVHPNYHRNISFYRVYSDWNILQSFSDGVWLFSWLVNVFGSAKCESHKVWTVMPKSPPKIFFCTQLPRLSVYNHWGGKNLLTCKNLESKNLDFFCFRKFLKLINLSSRSQCKMGPPILCYLGFTLVQWEMVVTHCPLLYTANILGYAEVKCKNEHLFPLNNDYFGLKDNTRPTVCRAVWWNEMQIYLISVGL